MLSDSTPDSQWYHCNLHVINIGKDNFVKNPQIKIISSHKQDLHKSNCSVQGTVVNRN